MSFKHIETDTLLSPTHGIPVPIWCFASCVGDMQDSIEFMACLSQQTYDINEEDSTAFVDRCLTHMIEEICKMSKLNFFFCKQKQVDKIMMMMTVTMMTATTTMVWMIDKVVIFSHSFR